ncbi:MAG: hypothetical protein WAM04_14295 [Candidatus Sulfotelmatobacter sp.]
MTRSTGVTVVSILSLIGSLLTLAMGLLLLAVTVFVPNGHTPQFPGSPATFKALMAAASLVYLLPATWGVATAIGLWRLKNWARISIIVFSVLLSFMGAVTGLVMLVIRFPSAPTASPDPAAMATVRIVMGGFWLTLMGIGIWWLVFFTRAKVAEQFARPSLASSGAGSPQGAQPTEGRIPEQSGVRKTTRPLSITIIAWLLLFGCVFMPWALVFRIPAVVFTSLVAGRAAFLVYVCFIVAQLCIGVGLLRLKPAARIGAIAYFVFGFANAAVFYFAPGGHARLAALVASEQSIFPWTRQFQDQAQYQFDLTPSLILGSLVGLVLIAVQLYFLITRKRAFEISNSDSQPARTGM